MNKILGLAVVGAGLLIALLSDDSEASIKPEKIEPVEPVEPERVYSTRGIKNNNAGNIKKTDDIWQGSAGDDGTFVIFSEPEYGIRALTKILLRYYHEYGLVSVIDIITRYAPSSENDTQNYINFVSEFCGVDPLETLNMPNAMFNLVDAIIQFENGMNPYSFSLMARGLSLAGVNT